MMRKIPVILLYNNKHQLIETVACGGSVEDITDEAIQSWLEFFKATYAVIEERYYNTQW
jgi:hypothetical protein